MIIDTGIKAKSYISRAWDTGETMYEITFDAESEARFGGPYLNIHRGDLHAGARTWHRAGNDRLQPSAGGA